MPLKDRDRSTPRRLSRLGIIRLGHMQTKKRKDGTEVSYPVQDDHFLLHDAPEIAEVYGNNARELDVMLPFPDIRRNIDGWYMVWAGGVQVCKGDGEFVEHASPMRVEQKGTKTSVYNEAGDTLVDGGTAQCSFSWNGSDFEAGDLVPCPGAGGAMYPQCAACQKAVLLKVMMSKPELFRLGYYQVSTGSGRNYDALLGTLEIISSNGARPVNGIPFKLRLVQQNTVYTDHGKRKPTTKLFLQLEPDPGFTRELYVKGAQALISAPEPALDVDTVTGEIIDEDAGDAPPPYAETGQPATGDWNDETFDAGQEAEAEAEPDTSPVADTKWLKRWGELWSKGKALGITGELVETVQGEITEAALKIRAAALTEKIAQVEADLAAKQTE